MTRQEDVDIFSTIFIFPHMDGNMETARNTQNCNTLIWGTDMPMIKVKYGNTNTFYCPSPNGGLLVDTDYAGTMVAFYKAIKKAGFEVKDIS